MLPIQRILLFRRSFLAQQRGACRRATLAGLCANTAMLHLLAVFLADFATAFANLDAGAKLCACDVEVRARESRNNARSCEANVRAIVAVADALHHLGDVLLAETRISAGITCFRAGVGRRNTFNGFPVIR
jgi:hypothetical protein